MLATKNDLAAPAPGSNVYEYTGTGTMPTSTAAAKTHLVLTIYLLVLQLSHGVLTFEPLPKVHVNELSISDFETNYLNKKPIILTGTTACPTKLDFSNIHDYCRGEIPGSYINKKSTQESKWAGLEEGDKRKSVNFNEWVDDMGSGKEEPEFLFDVPMAELCPTLMSEVMIPGHFVGIFASQYKYRKSQSSAEQLRGNANVKAESSIQADAAAAAANESVGISNLCYNLPFYNMYLAEDSFQTDLHIDAGHTAFMASMCVGRKRWRVMTNSDYASVYETIGIDGQLVNETLVLGSLHSPFNTWNDDADDFVLKSLNVTVYEGILEPGQILYIPAGAPHAATTLDKSLMVASNDHTLQNLREAVGYCDIVDDNHVACHDFRIKLDTMERASNLHLMKDVKRETMSLPKSTGCESTYELLRESSDEGLLMITPQNFRTLVEEGPVVIIKSQKNCGSCLYLLNHWESITQGFTPPVRFGVLHCFQGQCSFGEDTLYQELLELFEVRSSPAFLFVTLKSTNRLTISEYYGSLSFDQLRVWASVHSGSSIVLEPLWWKRLLQCFHLSAAFFAGIVNTVGPIGFFFLVIGILFATMTIWDYICDLLETRGSSRRNMGKRKKA